MCVLGASLFVGFPHSHGKKSLALFLNSEKKNPKLIFSPWVATQN